MNSKQKGNRFEREISRFFSSLFTDEKKDIFWRTPSSGGKFTQNKKSNTISENIEGDIFCIDENYSWISKNLIIECKNYKKLDLDKLFYEPEKSIIKEWIDKINSSNKKYFLIIKENKREPLLITDSKYKVFFPENNYAEIKKLNIILIKLKNLTREIMEKIILS